MKRILISTSLLAASACVANAAVFLPISAFGHNMVSANPGGDPEMIGGPGTGFDAAEPHSKLGEDSGSFPTLRPPPLLP